MDNRIFGIDISKWQKGYPYDAANKEGVKFAILRAGYSESKDTEFETHYANAKKLGWGVGAYWYMYATTIEEAKKEAQTFLKVIQGKQFEYPIYLDIEDPSLRGLGKSLLNSMIREFGEIIENAGYYFGVYTNMDWYKNVIDGAELNKQYDWWIASWSSSAPGGVNYGLWQFGGETNYIKDNTVAGVVTDQNYAFRDYPKLIKNAGLNGLGKEVVKPTPAPAPAKKSNEEIANEVIAGKWGVQPDRQKRLEAAGYNYETIRGLVNAKLAPKKPQAQYYTIKPGDTLYGLSIKFGTTINQLVKWNNIKNANKIYAGQKIRVK